MAKARGDTHNNALWAPTVNKYVAFTREFPDRIRTVARMESEDFVHWTKPVEVLRGPREAQTYSMPVFHDAGVYLGLPAILHGRVHTELAMESEHGGLVPHRPRNSVPSAGRGTWRLLLGLYLRRR